MGQMLGINNVSEDEDCLQVDKHQMSAYDYNIQRQQFVVVKRRTFDTQSATGLIPEPLLVLDSSLSRNLNMNYKSAMILTFHHLLSGDTEKEKNICYQSKQSDKSMQTMQRLLQWNCIEADESHSTEYMLRCVVQDSPSWILQIFFLYILFL